MPVHLRVLAEPGTESAAERYFCSKPFKWLDVQGGGQAFLCCPSWMPPPIGNLGTHALADVWNGAMARHLRESILDNSFNYCTKLCPWLHTKSGPVQKVSEITDPELLAIIEGNQTELPYGPRFLNCSFDRSCNLSCPSCRPRMIIEVDNKDRILALQAKLEREAFDAVEVIYITGSGDAFGSPYFLAWLRQMRVERIPRLRAFHLHTNAQLWNPRVWHSIGAEVRAFIKSAEISIDAASATTYAINRRGGTWDRLLRNLDFISALRANGPLEYVKIHMVVQENNYKEMPAFVELGKRLGFDSVYFSQLTNWGTFSDVEFLERAVHRPEHPSHGQLLEVLRDRVFENPIVNLGNLAPFAEAAKRPVLPAAGSIAELIGAMI